MVSVDRYITIALQTVPWGVKKAPRTDRGGKEALEAEGFYLLRSASTELAP